MRLADMSTLWRKAVRFNIISRQIAAVAVGLPNPDKSGGLNGSTQHLLKVHVQESTKLNSFKGVDANGTLPCLGSD